MASPTGRVQHLTKASSDELLSKFADSDPVKNSPNKPQLLLRGPLVRRKRSPRRIKRSSARDCNHSGTTESLAEWKALLHPPSSRRSTLLRQIGIAKGRSEFRASKIAGIGFLLAALEKTWRKTVEGASKMLAEKHCDRHVRLISDAV